MKVVNDFENTINKQILLAKWLWSGSLITFAFFGCLGWYLGINPEYSALWFFMAFACVFGLTNRLRQLQNLPKNSIQAEQIIRQDYENLRAKSIFAARINIVVIVLVLFFFLLKVMENFKW